ncbi:MAG TPA: hypothetical protein VFJ97_06755 [Dermatophilaceae bacterium]|nr:hypothetical protein [Dermatophilaceae bacterium]
MKTIAQVITATLTQDAIRVWRGLPENAGPAAIHGWDPRATHR